MFGPEYNFPGNCYSENIKVLPKMAEAHGMTRGVIVLQRETAHRLAGTGRFAACWLKPASSGRGDGRE